MQLEVGKFYKNRRGQKCEVVSIQEGIYPVSYYNPTYKEFYTCELNGVFRSIYDESVHDLIEEWHESIDMIVYMNPEHAKCLSEADCGYLCQISNQKSTLHDYGDRTKKFRLIEVVD